MTTPAVELTDDEKVDLLLESKSLERDAAGKSREKSAHLKRGCAVGMRRGAWVLWLKAMKLDDPEPLIEDVAAFLRYWNLTRQRQRPIVAGDLFDGTLPIVSNAATHAIDIWDAYNFGYKAGYGGEDGEASPHAAGSELDAEWHKGWHAGQAARARELGPDAHQARAGKRGQRPRWAGANRIPGTERRQPAPRLVASNGA